jgi:hypothetical protein
MEAYPDVKTLPIPIHLETSRRSLFGPTFAVNESAAIRIFHSQYPDASALTFLKALLPPELLSQIEAADLHRLSFTGIQILVTDGLQPYLSESFYNDCKDYTNRQLELLKQYFLERGVLLESSNIVICDIGWRGTMQDMLAEIEPKSRTFGVYLGLFPYKLEQPENTSKHAVVFDGNLGDDFAYVDPPAAIERTWTPNVGSAVAYHSNQTEHVQARLDHSDCTVAAGNDIALFQSEVIAVSPAVARLLLRFGIGAGGGRTGLQRLLKKYYVEPDAGIAEIWFGSLHDDTFGSGVNPYKKAAPPLAEVSSENILYLLHKCGIDSRWQSGYRKWSKFRWFEAMLRK